MSKSINIISKRGLDKLSSDPTSIGQSLEELEAASKELAVRRAELEEKSLTESSRLLKKSFDLSTPQFGFFVGKLKELSEEDKNNLLDFLTNGGSIRPNTNIPE